MDVNVYYKGGGSFVQLPPQFSHDGEYIFVCSKNTLLQYNTKTGKLIHEYVVKNKIIGFKHYLYNSMYCLTACCEEGKIYNWKVITHFKTSSYQLPAQNIETFYLIEENDEFYNVLYSYKKKNNVHFALWNSKTKKSNEYKFILNISSPYYIDVGKGFFSVVHKNEIYFLKLQDFQNFHKQFLGNKRKFTCINCHQNEETVLTGDSTGRVIAWQDIFSKNPTQAVFHWHTLPVRTVCFSNFGSYFYSGGGESVVVKWAFENVNERRFIPRLPDEINHIRISNNNSFITVSTSDNAVRIFDNTLNQISLIQHLVLANHFDSGIVHNLRSRSLIMNGNQGHIQFYSPDDMSLLYSVDIVGQNKITNERGVEMINTEITKVAINKSGLWLSSVEERNDHEYSNEIRLKFWKFEEAKQQFNLNTSIEYPHESSINSMNFAPLHKDDNLICITVGNDKMFKLWQVTETEQISEIQLTWKCLGIGFYRDLHCRALSFSVDGSLFATGFAEILTVWTTDACILKCSLNHPLYKETIKSIEFGQGNQCHLLVSASSNRINVWNILTLSMIWTVPLNVSFLIADSLSSIMAAITTDNKVFIFSPNSSQPLYVNEDLLKKFKFIKACSFIPKKDINDPRLQWYERTQIFFITSENELYSLNGNESVEDFNEDQLIETSYHEMITPQIKSGTVSSINVKNHYSQNSYQNSIKEYLDQPLHTLAPIRFSCRHLLESFVKKK